MILDATGTHQVGRAFKFVRRIVKHHKRRTPRGYLCPMSTRPIPRVVWIPW